MASTVRHEGSATCGRLAMLIVGVLMLASSGLGGSTAQHDPSALGRKPGASSGIGTTFPLDPPHDVSGSTVITLGSKPGVVSGSNLNGIAVTTLGAKLGIGSGTNRSNSTVVS